MEFYECKVTAIIGPSGYGKSTLIKSINRISEITNDVQVEGKVLLDNKNVYDRDVDLVDLRRRVGMVFQRPNPFPKSIYDNVAFGPRLYGVNNKKRLDEIVEYSFGQVGHLERGQGSVESECDWTFRRATTTVVHSACAGS